MSTTSGIVAQLDNRVFANSIWPAYPPNYWLQNGIHGTPISGPNALYATVVDPTWSNPNNLYQFGLNGSCGNMLTTTPRHARVVVAMMWTGVAPNSAPYCKYSMGGQTSVNGVSVDTAISYLLSMAVKRESFTIHDAGGWSIAEKCRFWPGVAESSQPTFSYSYGKYGPHSLDFSGTTGGLYNVTLGSIKYLFAQMHDATTNSCPTVVYY